ncbi:MAG: GAF domain-containing sensor histidine kinase [Deinococcales bacterium]
MIRSAGHAPDAERPGSLYDQVRLARLWLPLTIVGVVLLHQLVVVPLGGERYQFWAQLLFYSILGPLATFVTLNWIATEVRLREQAQDELARLFDQLRSSHELLTAIQQVTEQFAAATDLEAALGAASRGIRDVTGASAVAVLVGPPQFGVTSGVGLSSEHERDAIERDRALRDHQRRGERTRIGGRDGWVLTMPLTWGGNLEGSLHAYYESDPDDRQREAFSILTSEFSAAAEATRSRTRDLLTLFDVDRSIRAEGNLERLLRTLLVQMMSRVEARMGGVYLLDGGNLLQLRSAEGPPQGAASLPVRLGEGLVGRSARSREPRIVSRLSQADRAEGGPLLAGAGSAVTLPLHAEEGLFGLVVLTHPDPDHFDAANLPFLGLLASQVSLAVRNANAYLHSEELAIAEERARIAREIHDGVAQSLAFTALKLDLVTRLLSRDEAKAVAELDAAKDTVRETIKEVRRSIFALRPVDLERYGFLETVRRYAIDFGQQNDVHVRLELGDLPDLGIKSEAVLFRIFQEAMNNVAKHASARTVDIRVGADGDAMAFISVQDDGKGFDPITVGDRVTSAGGLGLRQMRERVQARGGRFEIESEPGRGTRVLAAVPE